VPQKGWHLEVFSAMRRESRQGKVLRLKTAARYDAAVLRFLTFFCFIRAKREKGVIHVAF
jgi:hypothetical protein